MTNQAAERVQDIRDLRDQITGLQREDEQEMVFRDTSPRRQVIRVYSIQNGEPITIPRKMLENVLKKRLEDGRYAFTARQEEAPVYIKGKIKCFLHFESPDRPILNEIGLSGKSCPAAQLPNEYSKRIHAQHRHKDEWAMYQDYLTKTERDEDREQRRQQLDATLAIAGRAAGTTETLTCDECGFEAKNLFGLKAHQRKHE